MYVDHLLFLWHSVFLEEWLGKTSAQTVCSPRLFLANSYLSFRFMLKRYLIHCLPLPLPRRSSVGTGTVGEWENHLDVLYIWRLGLEKIDFHGHKDVKLDSNRDKLQGLLQRNRTGRVLSQINNVNIESSLEWGRNGSQGTVYVLMEPLG